MIQGVKMPRNEDKFKYFNEIGIKLPQHVLSTTQTEHKPV